MVLVPSHSDCYIRTSNCQDGMKSALFLTLSNISATSGERRLPSEIEAVTDHHGEIRQYQACLPLGVDQRNSPCRLITCPIFRAAPLTRQRVATIFSMLAWVINGLSPTTDVDPSPRVLFVSSMAVPIPKLAASPRQR